MSDSIKYAARELVLSNLGWFKVTRETLGEGAGRERAININHEVMTDWFGGELEATNTEVITRYAVGDSAEPSESAALVLDSRTIRLQGGGKNWRLAGNAVEGQMYDARVADLMLMAFDSSTRTLSWMLVRHDLDPLRPVPPAEARAYTEISSLLGSSRGSMWIVSPELMVPVIAAASRAYPYASELLGSAQAESSASGPETILLRDDGDVDRQLRRRLRVSTEIDDGASGTFDTPRANQRAVEVTYNYDLQEQASMSHRHTLKVLAQHLRALGLLPRQSNIDAYVANAERAMLFEVKSIHNRNEREQTRKAVGQLLDYAFFELPPEIPDDADVTRCVVYSRKPSDGTVEFLESIGLSVLWLESDESIAGTEESEAALESIRPVDEVE